MIRRSLSVQSRCLALVFGLCFLPGSTALQAQTAAASHFIFPRFTLFAEESTGIAVFNPNRYAAQVTFTLREANGSLVDVVSNPATVTVPARGQTAKTAGELFGSVDLWTSLEITSSSPGLLAYYQTFDPGMTYLDGSEAPLISGDLIIPVIPGPNEGLSEIDFVNPNSRETSVELKLWNFEGRLLGTATIHVPGGGFYQNLTHLAFPAGTDFSGASHITAASKPRNVFSVAQTVAATSLFAGFSSTVSPEGDLDLAALNAVPLTETSNSGVIPYFRSGGSYASTLSLTNVEPAAATVTVTAVANNGSTLGTRSISLNAQGGLRAPLQNIIPLLGSGEREGWLLIQSSGRITGALIYGASDEASLTAAPLQRTPKTEILFNHIVEGYGLHTEVSLVNPTPNTAGADVVVVGPDGTTLAADHVSIGPSKRAFFSLGDLLPELEDQCGGVIYVLTNEPLFATAAIWSDAGGIASNFTPQTTSFLPAPLASFAVSGRVYVNDAPAAGFPVVLSGPVGMLATSAADGTYIFTDVPPGRYTMMVEQSGFRFVPAQVDFEITNTSRRQDFAGFTGSDNILVQPASAPVGSSDTALTIYGMDFNPTSEAFAGTTRLHTQFVDATHLQAVLPAYMMESPASFEIVVVTNGSNPSRRVSQPLVFMAYQDRPVLASIGTQGIVLEGTPGGIVRLEGSGFLEGARVKVNGLSEGIQTILVSNTELLAYLPSTYFERGGIYPVTVENPVPANVESNIQLLAVYFAPPSVETVLPNSTPVRLEPGAGPLNIEVVGYGFRRGAVVLFNGEPLLTTYCESDAYCLTVRLHAKIPPEFLNIAGFAKIEVRNPAPSLANSQAAILRIDGLRPAITSVQAGSAALLDLPFAFSMPVIVNGTNFGTETMVRVYKAEEDPPEAFLTSHVEVISSTQLVVEIHMEYPYSLGEWKIEVANPSPGGGISQDVSFFVTEGAFAANPFLISLTPQMVAAGGPSFTLTINGTNFKPGTVINFNYAPLVTTVISDRQARAQVPASLIRSAGKIPISVTNPDTGGTSNLLFLEIR
ncbi:MAG: cell surface receptor domain protein [Acidobacteria bacterium]|nr:cell surface receptor domain protein [Acidobacteriota bacterium]